MGNDSGWVCSWKGKTDVDDDQWYPSIVFVTIGFIELSSNALDSSIRSKHEHECETEDNNCLQLLMITQAILSYHRATLLLR